MRAQYKTAGIGTYQHSFSLTYIHCGVATYEGGLTMGDDNYHECVVLAVIAHDFMVQFKHIGGEKGGSHHIDRNIFFCFIFYSLSGAIVEVGGFFCKLCMKFALFAVGSLAMVIIETVGIIGCLLDFSYKRTFTDGVYTSCRYKVYITFFDFIEVK